MTVAAFINCPQMNISIGSFTFLVVIMGNMFGGGFE